MARGQIKELGLAGTSFHSSSSSRALVARRTAACAICLLASCVLAVILSRSSGDSKTALFDGYEGTWRPSGAKTGRETNAYEDQPAFDAEWTQRQLQEHLVTTQRIMTTENKDMSAGVQKLDTGVEELMRLLKKRPPGAAGQPGNPGKPGAKGAAGAAGKPGPDGASGLAGQPGRPGQDGTPGAPGRPGNAGVAGMAGRPGDFGPPGVPGREGPAGPVGQMGQIGRKGRHGLQGPPGPPGVPAYLHAVHHYPNDDSDTSGAEDAATGGGGGSVNNGGNSADESGKQTSGSSALHARRHQQALRAGDQHLHSGDDGKSGDANSGSPEEAYKRTLRLGWKKEGDLAVAQVRINSDKGSGYEVHVAAPRGDAIRATLRGEDGFVKTWKGTSSLISGAIAAGAPGTPDFLKVTDRTRDETQYFRLKGANGNE